MGCEVDTVLGELLEAELQDVPDCVADPVRYAVLGPGKRLRPLLVMASFHATGGESERVALLACSVELVHAYSLVHDDLPCMDDDVLRRGRPTLHVRYGVPNAVLAGAALMPLAIRAVVDGGARLGLDGPTVRRLIRTLTEASGARGMVGGQLLDLRAEGCEVTRSELEAIHLGKTAALIGAAVVMGGVAAAADEEAIARLRSFGRYLGLAFQVVDDILDMRGTSTELGKESGRDVQLGKATFPALFGLDEAERISREYAASASREIEGLSHPERLREIARYVIDRRH
jgi:geranylgeranyl pyrophosphate synthase